MQAKVITKIIIFVGSDYALKCVDTRTTSFGRIKNNVIMPIMFLTVHGFMYVGFINRLDLKSTN